MKAEIEKKLDSQEFYEVMMAYRNEIFANQYEVTQKFNDVKRWIVNNLSTTPNEVICGDCNNPLTLVRPGKHQCDNIEGTENKCILKLTKHDG
jgi:hypothetical protein